MYSQEELNEMIEDLEADLNTFTDCQKLASLYIISEKQKSRSNSIVECSDMTLRELNDILPQYKNYCMIKKRYQLNELPKQTVIYAMKDVCKELSEFIQILYSSTDTSEEREELRQMLNNLHL